MGLDPKKLKWKRVHTTKFPTFASILPPEILHLWVRNLQYRIGWDMESESQQKFFSNYLGSAVAPVSREPGGTHSHTLESTWTYQLPPQGAQRPWHGNLHDQLTHNTMISALLCGSEVSSAPV